MNGFLALIPSLHYRKWMAAFLILQLWITPCQAQKEANVWITGDDFAIDFNFNRFRVFDRRAYDHSTNTSVSISDKQTGELLFYSNGITVWNKNFNIMPNGKDIKSRAPSTIGQQALIIPMPSNSERYYLFTAKNIRGADGNGLYYSIIDMSLDGGLGDVLEGSKNKLLFPNAMEALTGTLHSNGRDFWLLTHEANSNRLVIFHISPQGISKPSFYSLGFDYTTMDFFSRPSDGSLQISPDRTRLAIGMNVGNPFGIRDYLAPLELYDFNASTGEISNRRVLGEYAGISTVLFSPDNSKLYMGCVTCFGDGEMPPEILSWGLLRQYDLSAGSTEQIMESLDTISWGFRPFFGNEINDPIVPLPSHRLQLAPDGRLYNGAMALQDNQSGGNQRAIFYLERPNELLKNAKPKFRYLDSPNNMNFKPEPGSVGIVSTFGQSFPNFMQYHFNGLEPIDNSITSGECATIQLRVYPNPTEDFFSLKSSIDNCLYPTHISIYNAIGKLMQNLEVREEPFPKIDISTYSPGIYFLQVQTFNRTELMRVIKN